MSQQWAHTQAEQLPPPAPDYEADPIWRQKPLTPAQVLIHDISYGKTTFSNDEVLEINEVPSASLVHDGAKYNTPDDNVRAKNAARNPIEQQRFQRIEEQFGWIKHLRLDPETSKTDRKLCRWTHVSSKFPEYLPAFLWSLSDHKSMSASLSSCMRGISEVIDRNKRHSKHGEYFIPFCERLLEDPAIATTPVLMSCPWLDWGINDTPPALRFQVDRREKFSSARTSSHLLRSILQYYYRLEDTNDREKLQVFTKHKPWTTNKELDLRIRQWYGHYPTTLVVDELWILVVDDENIVTFSSNVTWKSRWPPLQLSARIANVSFRNYRNTFGHSSPDYDSSAHAMTCLTGAIGMLHRGFWPDMPLCVTDRFAGYLGHLQYRLHRAPSTKLVMSLISCYDELNIVIQITRQQMDLLLSLQDLASNVGTTIEPASTTQRRPRTATNAQNQSWEYAATGMASIHQHTTYRTNILTSRAGTPLMQAIDSLQRELVDLEDLRDNTNALIMRTIQLVNIRLEDNGKAILVFTVVTIVFLPLNFIASFFGMNVSDIRNLDQTQGLFWLVACLVTLFVAAVSTLVAFQGTRMLESFRTWRDNRDEVNRYAASMFKQRQQNTAEATANGHAAFGRAYASHKAG